MGRVEETVVPIRDKERWLGATPAAIATDPPLTANSTPVQFGFVDQRRVDEGDAAALG